MAVKLGDLLLKQKLITQDQLETALKSSGLNDNHDVDELAFAAFRTANGGDSTKIVGIAQGQFSLQDILAIAEPIVAARIAATEQRNDEALMRLREAVAAEDKLSYNEPADWFFPARHLLGAQLLIAGRAAEAERVYREDLQRNPGNGWALYGLAAALRGQGRNRDAARVTREFESAWRHDSRMPRLYRLLSMDRPMRNSMDT